MRFALTPEQRDFAASLRDLLSAADVASVVRCWADGDWAPGRSLWTRLGEAGVTALGLDKHDGGYGATAVDLIVGFEELGRFAVPGPLVESVAVLPVLLTGTDHGGTLESIASGTRLATLAVPPHVPYALDAECADAVYLLDGSRLSQARVSNATAVSLDKARHLAEVAASELVAGDADAARAFDVGALACAAQLLGLGVALLEMARSYAMQRVQFGRPIGAFQAVKHQLADALVDLELARPLLWGAALAYDERSATVVRDVSAAKLACSAASYRAARVSLQVHGAIGYTAEYDLSLWLTKVRALVSAWGTQATHRARVLAAL